MKKIGILFIVLLTLAGCSGKESQSVIENKEVKGGATSVVQTSSTVVGSETMSQDLGSQAKKMITNKEDPFKVLEVYKQMIQVYEAKSQPRQDTIRYILDANMQMIRDGKGQDALKLALEIDKLIPNDFYVQNRVIGAYRVLAEEQIGKKNFAAAMDLIQKGLLIRFDQDIMTTKLKTLILMAKEDIKNGKMESAKKELNEVLYIIDAQDSEAEKNNFAKEKTEATNLLTTIK